MLIWDLLRPPWGRRHKGAASRAVLEQCWCQCQCLFLGFPGGFCCDTGSVPVGNAGQGRAGHWAVLSPLLAPCRARMVAGLRFVTSKCGHCCSWPFCHSECLQSAEVLPCASWGLQALGLNGWSAETPRISSYSGWDLAMLITLL